MENDAKFEELIRKSNNRLEITQVCRKFDMPNESGENTVCLANELIRRSGYESSYSEKCESSTTQQPAGLPSPLRMGIEALSGVGMGNVKVHRDSSEPRRLGAAAFAQGAEIHLAHGQEQHIAHEAWHLVQQAQGRVEPTIECDGVMVNDDPYLELEAEVMGAQAWELGLRLVGQADIPVAKEALIEARAFSAKNSAVVQRAVHINKIPIQKEDESLGRKVRQRSSSESLGANAKTAIDRNEIYCFDNLTDFIHTLERQPNIELWPTAQQLVSDQAPESVDFNLMVKPWIYADCVLNPETMGAMPKLYRAMSLVEYRELIGTAPLFRHKPGIKGVAEKFFTPNTNYLLGHMGSKGERNIDVEVLFEREAIEALIYSPEHSSRSSDIREIDLDGQGLKKSTHSIFYPVMVKEESDGKSIETKSINVGFRELFPGGRRTYEKRSDIDSLRELSRYIRGIRPVNLHDEVFFGTAVKSLREWEQAMREIEG